MSAGPTSPAVRLPGRAVLRWLPGVVLTLAAFAFLAYKIDWSVFWIELASFPIEVLALAVLIYLVSMLARAIASYILLQRKVSLGTAILVMNEGYFLNNILPARVGEIGRAWLMGRRSGLGSFWVFSTIVVERAYDVAFAAALLLMTLPLVLNMGQSFILVIILLVVIVIGLFSVYLAARNREWLEGLLGRIIGQHRFLQHWVLPRVRSLLDGFSVLAKPQYFFLSLFFMAATWGTALLRDWMLIRHLSPEAPFWWAVLAISASNLAGALPSTMASVGVFEGAAVAALSLVGVPSEQALAYALIVHVTHFISSSVIGAYGLSQEGKSISELVAEIRSARQPSS